MRVGERRGSVGPQDEISVREITRSRAHTAHSLPPPTIFLLLVRAPQPPVMEPVSSFKGEVKCEPSEHRKKRRGKERRRGSVFRMSALGRTSTFKIVFLFLLLLRHYRFHPSWSVCVLLKLMTGYIYIVFTNVNESFAYLTFQVTLSRPIWCISTQVVQHRYTVLQPVCGEGLCVGGLKVV